MWISIRSVNVCDYYTVPYHLPPSKTTRVGGLFSRTLTTRLVLWATYISLQERQERVGPGRSRGDVTRIDGGCGRSGFVGSYWASPEARVVGRLWWNGRGEFVYGPDAVI